ncbi:RFX DNA-binding domain-containing protein [Phycomyces nitens]|nr:RFX DNA-binding domain-containing protein [Phycomyces nitens]
MARTKSKSKNSGPSTEQIVSANDNDQDLFEKPTGTALMNRVDGLEGSDQPIITRSRQHSISDISSIEGISEDNRERRDGSFQDDTELGLSAADRATSQRVTDWVQSNYEYEHEHNVPRSGMYEHYKTYCDSHDIEAVNSATFGKLIRTVFPGIKTRRLGTRGQSKYHYCNIRLRTSRQDPTDLVGIQGSLDQRERGSDENGSQLVPVADRSHFDPFDDSMSHVTLPSTDETTLLYPIPESPQSTTRASSSFPSLSTHSTASRSVLPSKRSHPGNISHHVYRPGSQIDLPHLTHLAYPQQNNGQDLPSAFMNLYEKHCRDILNHVLAGKFQQADSSLALFYQSMIKEHFEMIKDIPDIWDTIWRWDSVLYDTIIVKSLPSIDAPLSQKMHRGLSKFAHSIVGSMDSYLKGFPQRLYQKKYEVAYIFASKLQRHLSLNGMAQAAAAVLKEPSNMRQIRTDWNDMDIECITDQGLWICDCKTTLIQQILRDDIPKLLMDEVDLEAWMKWIDSIMEMYMNRFQVRQTMDCEHYIVQAKQLVMKWTFYTSLVMRDLMLRDAESLGHIRTLCMFFDDFVLYLLEERIARMNMAVLQSSRAALEAGSRANSLRPPESTEAGFEHQRDYGAQTPVPPVSSIHKEELS